MLPDHESEPTEENEQGSDKFPFKALFGVFVYVCCAQGDQYEQYGIQNKMMGWVVADVIRIILFFHLFFFFKVQDFLIFPLKQQNLSALKVCGIGFKQIGSFAQRVLSLLGIRVESCGVTGRFRPIMKFIFPGWN